MKKELFFFSIIIILILVTGCEDNTIDSKIVYGPRNISASDGIYNDRIVIRWEKEADAVKYKIYRVEEENGVSKFITVVATNIYVDKSIETSKKYLYFVTSLNSNGEESKQDKNDVGYSSSDAFDVPEKIEASKGTYKNKIAIAWTTVKGAVSYKVYRATTSNDSPAYIGMTLGETSTAYIDNIALSGVTYYYYVSAVSSKGIESTKTDYSIGYW